MMFRMIGTGLLLLSLSSVGLAETAPAAKPPFTVVTFGDSTTALRAGVDVYTDQLARRFPGVQFLNRGIGGNNTEHGRLRLEHDVLAAKPNLVIIQYGMNDSVYDVWKKPPADKPRVALGDFERNLRGFVTAVREAHGSVVLMTPNQRRWSPILLEKYSRPPYDPKDEKGFLFLMIDYVDAIRRVAREMDVPLVDVFKLYDQWEQASGKSCSDLMLDGQHPNTLGQKLVADALEPEIAKFVARRPTP